MEIDKIHHFPGHMKKAFDTLSRLLSLVDLVIEIVDARAPLSSANPFLHEAIGGKKSLLVFTKTDLADPERTKRWASYYREKGHDPLTIDLKKEKALPKVLSLIEPLLAAKREKEKRYGMKPQKSRLLIVGIPNVGKSTLINNLAGRNRAKSANRPGVTRAEQWINLPSSLMLLDTPGILPSSYGDAKVAIKLALLGSISQEVLPGTDLARALFGYLRENYPHSLAERYGIADLSILDSDLAFKEIATRRGFLSSGGEPDLDKAALALLKDFQDGKLGRLSLEEPSDA